MTDTYEYRSAWADSLRAEGEARGVAEGAARAEARGMAGAVLRILAARGIDVPERARERINGSQDPEVVNSWLVRSITVSHVNELFDE